MQHFVETARTLVGARFRAQGRDLHTGLDCAGVVILTYGLNPSHYRRDYRLRGDHQHALHAVLKQAFRRVARTECRPGDVMMLNAGRHQLHLAVRTDQGFVHADARLGLVTETPGLPDWPLIAVYRRRSMSRRSR